MLTKFFESVYFNIVLAVLAAFFAVAQEVMIGTAVPFLNIFILAACAGVGFSWAAQVIKFLVMKLPFNWGHVGYGAIAGIVVALITALIML